MYETTYHRPSSVDEAAALFTTGTESKYLAGGHTLIPVMKQRLASPSDVIDLGKIKDLVGVEVFADAVTIKAATAHYDVAGSGPVQKAIPALAHLASLIGDPAVRHRGTIGGSIANNDPAADYPAAVLALGATIKTNKRSIAADDFFKGLFATALQGGEIITAVSFRIPAKAGYAKFPHPASRFALTGVFVARTKELVGLNNRTEDIPLLIEYFKEKLSELNGVQQPKIDINNDNFFTYNWPGNVRELRNLVERITILSSNETQANINRIIDDIIAVGDLIKLK